MQLKNVGVIVALLSSQSAWALRPCPPKPKLCGPNPFYGLFVALTRTCSTAYPEKASVYQTALAQLIAEDPAAHARADADREVQKEIDHFHREFSKLSPTELEEECASFVRTK